MAKGGKGGSGSIRGNKRDNLLEGTSNADLIEGGAGNDTLLGSAGDDTLLGEADNDSLDGGVGADLLNGGIGSDTLLGGTGDDTLSGGDGDDALDGGSGNDEIDGGTGSDTVTLSGARDDFDVVQIDATTVQITGPDGTSDIISNVEAFTFEDMTQTFAEVIVPRLANLSAGTLTLAEADVLEGDMLQIDWSIASNGVVDAGGYDTTIVVASAPNMDAVFTTLDGQTSAGTATGSSQSFTSTTSTYGLAPGTYWVAAVADAGQAVGESDEGDNVSGWTQITIAPRVTSYGVTSIEVLPTSDFDLNPDLDPYGYPTGPDAQLDFAVSIFNDSNVGPSDFEITIWLSTDAELSGDDIQIYLGDPYSPSPQIATVGYGETAVVQTYAELPEYFPQGNYYVITAVHEYDPYGGGGYGPYDDPADNLIVGPQISLVGGFTYGTEGADLFVGTAVREKYEGYGGDDTLTGEIANDIFWGGDGFDLIDFSQLSHGIGVQGALSDPYYGGTPPNELTFGDVGAYDPYDMGLATDIEALIGTAFDDVILAYETTVSQIDGGDGNDAVLGSFSDDTIDGGAGDDQIGGLFGDDLITTGDGFDVVFVDRNPDGMGGFTGHGHDTVTDFDVLQDLLIVEYSVLEEPDYDPLTQLSQTTEGAVLTMADDSSILLLGVDVMDLNAGNLIAQWEEVAVYG